MVRACVCLSHQFLIANETRGERYTDAEYMNFFILHFMISQFLMLCGVDSRVGNAQ